MPQTINTNVSSLTAQRNLATSQSALSTAMQRLSSGLRVNSAKDDAAGLAIAERMNTQIRGLNVAARNANDGISLAQTAEGALGKVGDMLQRMRELAVQASNDTNSAEDRYALQSEVSQLRDEINRVAKTTNFNGARLLDGSFSAATFQVGANSGENITVAALANTSTAGLGKVNYGSSTTGKVTTDLITESNLRVEAGDLEITVGAIAYPLTALPPARSPEERLGQTVEAINRRTADSGVSAFLKKDPASGEFWMEIRSSKVDTNGDALPVTTSGFTTERTGVAPGAIDIAAGTPITGMESMTIETVEGSWLALKQIDDALQQVNGSRATLGAVQSRFENAISSIMIQSENTAASRGRIMDADFAAETASLSRSQILQQAGTAMVAQANQLPQQVLSLLKG
ncbi:flagellin [Piscinibacter sakaiensis]|uniref:flagellin n=1 Tax=Piscinibacter sakaiensis TaxID=1547922 RepID=UPI003AAE62AB